MLFRVDKCITFGIKKFSTSSLQFQPKLFINSKIVPPVKNGESFKYLGRFFNFDMDNKDHKEILKPSLQTMLKTVDSLYIHPKIGYFCIIATYSPKSLDILQLQICVRQGIQKTWIALPLTGFIRSGKVRGKGSFLLWSGKVREACNGQGQNSIFILQVREIFHFSPPKKYVQHFNN